MGCISAQKQNKNRDPNPQQSHPSTQKRIGRNFSNVNVVMRPTTSPHTSQIYPSVYMRSPTRQENFRNENFFYPQPPMHQEHQQQFSEAHSQISVALSQIERRREVRNVRQNQERRQNHQRQQVDDNLHQFQVLFYLFRILRTQSNLSQQQNMILFIRLLQILGSSQQSQGLNQQQIQNLQIRKAKKNDQVCSVCQESITIGQNIMELPCKHHFHPQCINPWLQKSDKCPMCRNSARRQN